MNKTGVIYGINGPVVYLKGNTGFKMSEMVYVGKERLVGEVIALTKDTTTVQVFEETTGLKPGETVTPQVFAKKSNQSPPRYVVQYSCNISIIPLITIGHKTAPIQACHNTVSYFR